MFGAKLNKLISRDGNGFFVRLKGKEEYKNMKQDALKSVGLSRLLPALGPVMHIKWA